MSNKLKKYPSAEESLHRLFTLGAKDKPSKREAHQFAEELMVWNKVLNDPEGSPTFVRKLESPIKYRDALNAVFTLVWASDKCLDKVEECMGLMKVLMQGVNLMEKLAGNELDAMSMDGKFYNNMDVAVRYNWFIGNYLP